jgi:hypothetical protein
MTSRRSIALVGIVFGLVVCRPGGDGTSRATPAADAGRAPDAAPAPAKTEPPLPARQCTQLKQRVERALSAAQKCKADSDCEASTFEYVFRPCGMAIAKGADLAKATADAKQYRERCNPVVHPVRCAHTPRAVCQRGRCALAPSEEK